MAQATKNVLRDAGSLFSDTAHEAVSAAVDTAHIALNSMKSKKEEWKEEHEKEDEPEDVHMEEDGFLYDYERLDAEPVYAEKQPSETEDGGSSEEDDDETEDVVSVELAEDEEGTILTEDDEPLV